MGGDDYQSLLLGYFDDFDNAGEAYLDMFVLVSVRCLDETTRTIHSAPSATVSIILGKMVRAAEAISRRQMHRNTHGCEHAKDDTWISRLYYRRQTLSESHAQLFRHLLHIFERSYARGVLTGDQDNIRQPLHESLEAAHTERKCEVAECPWISHQCPGTEDSRYAECPLLFTGNNTPPVPVSRLPGDIRIMLRLPHPPDLAPSTFGSSAPIPPSPYHPPFRRAIHATLRLSARHLPPITRQRTLPCR